MEAALIKVISMLPLMGVVGLMVAKLQEAENDLLMQKMDFREYELLKEGTLNATLIIFAMCVIIAL